MDRPESIAAPPKPTLLAALLCDTAAVDRRSGKESLLGIFDTIMVSQSPAARVFSLYLASPGQKGHTNFRSRSCIDEQQRSSPGAGGTRASRTL